MCCEPSHQPSTNLPTNLPPTFPRTLHELSHEPCTNLPTNLPPTFPRTFHQLSHEALRARVIDCKSGVVLTADEGLRARKVIKLKEVVDKALGVSECAFVRSVNLIYILT